MLPLGDDDHTPVEVTISMGLDYSMEFLGIL
jgi:hypothetical protein